MEDYCIQPKNMNNTSSWYYPFPVCSFNCREALFQQFRLFCFKRPVLMTALHITGNVYSVLFDQYVERLKKKQVCFDKTLMGRISCLLELLLYCVINIDTQEITVFWQFDNSERRNNGPSWLWLVTRFVTSGISQICQCFYKCPCKNKKHFDKTVSHGEHERNKRPRVT